jgi:hypothetical protein
MAGDDLTFAGFAHHRIARAKNAAGFPLQHGRATDEAAIIWRPFLCLPNQDRFLSAT